MTVYLVGAGPGDPGLLTRRGAELLAIADVVVHDRLVDPSILQLAAPWAERIDAGKGPGGPVAPGVTAPTGGTGRQAEINALLVERGRRGQTVVRLKGGDPFVFGRGGEEVEALRSAGVRWEVVPGVTSAVAVPASAGVPVTHRGLSTSVTVVTGHVGGATAPGGVDWESLAKAGGTIVILMGMANRAEIARRLRSAGRADDTPVAVVEWGTTPARRSVRTTLAGLGDVAMGSPSVIVVGPVAALDLTWHGDGALAGRTVVVTRPRGQAGELVAALAGSGARVVELPVIEVVGPEDGGAAARDAAVGVGGYQWVAFTSPNAVHHFVPLLRDGRAFGQAKLAAVGRATARALERHRLVADLVPGHADAEGLVRAFPDPPAGGRVLFPRAAAARETLPQGLRARGWQVDEVVAYRTVAAAGPEAGTATDLATADAVTFASPSAVAAYLGARDAAGRRLAVPPVAACIGPFTAEAARAGGFPSVLVSPSPSATDLVSVLAAAFAARAGGKGDASSPPARRAPR
ncbi:MAG TPA: uroporphyrinogen-III C-methyltransferase [Acidimicrobiales bacterium]|nr:uroporphyrinogen-III C-methyltransferase [Acidimicrobiales bacterium]